jgi:hypothetical protein
MIVPAQTLQRIFTIPSSILHRSKSINTTHQRFAKSLQVTSQQTNVHSSSILSIEDLQARLDFFKVILERENDDSFELNPTCLWYARFLECKFRASWTILLRPALEGSNKQHNDLQHGDYSRAYTFLSIVAKMMLQGDSLTIVEVSDFLGNERMLTDDNDERAIPNQLIFSAVGWLCEFLMISCFCIIC